MRRFDRVVSVEMFEHMRNYEALLARIAGWLRDGGTLFVHIFCHRAPRIRSRTRAHGDWMAPAFLHRRPDAVGAAPAALPAATCGSRRVAPAGHALRAHRRGLVTNLNPTVTGRRSGPFSRRPTAPRKRSASSTTGARSSSPARSSGDPAPARSARFPLPVRAAMTPRGFVPRPGFHDFCAERRL